MKFKAAVLGIVAVFSMAVPAHADVFKTWADGTAYVKGKVVGNIHGCELDGYCSIIVKVNGQELALIYNEGESNCSNPQAAAWVQWGKNVKNGTIINAYGAYKDLYMKFCGSKDYFILGENDPLPASLGGHTL